jgi:hypothetical protein
MIKSLALFALGEIFPSTRSSSVSIAHLQFNLFFSTIFRNSNGRKSISTNCSLLDIVPGKKGKGVAKVKEELLKLLQKVISRIFLELLRS